MNISNPKNIFDKYVSVAGTDKAFKVVASSLSGAVIFGFMAMIIIPNNPDVIHQNVSNAVTEVATEITEKENS